MNDFIFELGCEELPSGAVQPLAKELANALITGLNKAQLHFSDINYYATPRRLAVKISALQDKQAAQMITRRGPAVVAAFDSEGIPTPALLGFAKSCQVDVSQLSRIKTDKGEWMVYEAEQPGTDTKILLPQLVKEAVAQLPIPKPMRWGDSADEFIRPVHWVVMLYGDSLIEETILGISTGRHTYGHRFHHPEKILINSAGSYEQQLKDAFVIADFSTRKAWIEKQVEQLASEHHAIAVMPESLLDEVTSIVEWPQALLAHFEKEFLDVPSEALIASMQSHQKCFALKDHQGALLPYFITVANIQSANPSQVIAGNEKVMRARLSDAAFFYKQDRKKPLSHHILGTQQVIFQEKLGSLYQKTQRMKQLMVYLGNVLGLVSSEAERAAELSKCDLLSGMVGEFPELQGLMGSYYALHDGESPAVACALNEQYMPRFAVDELPQSLLGKALSLADRIDTLVGIFAVGQKPSGVKDPFKLRRHALAVVRILISIETPLAISELIAHSIASYSFQAPEQLAALAELKSFIWERFNSYYQSQSMRIDLIHAVRARQSECLYDADNRLNALNLFIALPEAASLSAACKRVNNLLDNAQHESDNVHVDVSKFQEEAEKALYEQMMDLSGSVDTWYQNADYCALLKALAGLKSAVDCFFDTVMVLVDDLVIRQNRLALLKQLQQLLQGVADISLLQWQ